jgi:hypothetical protein
MLVRDRFAAVNEESSLVGPRTADILDFMQLPRDLIRFFGRNGPALWRRSRTQLIGEVESNMRVRFHCTYVRQLIVDGRKPA